MLRNRFIRCTRFRQLILVVFGLLMLFVYCSFDFICENKADLTEDLSATSDNNTNYNVGLGLKNLQLFGQRTRGPETRHVAFVKVHKAASTTVLSVFLRFGWERNLRFMLPSTSPNIISQNSSITDKNIILTTKDEKFDIVCNHVIYNRKAFQKYLPKDTVYIGIVREPFDQFVSSLHYYKYRWMEPYLARLPYASPVKYLLEDPKQYEPKLPLNSFTKNRMSVDFGLPLYLFKTYNHNEIMPYLLKLQREFKLVMIKEYFDESLVLLRRYLNWGMKDILYTTKNSFSYRATISPTDRILHKRHSFLDYCLYNFFLERFWKQVRKEGEDFHTEVNYFRQLRASVETYCLDAVSRRKGTHQIIFEAKANEFHPDILITRDYCDLLIMGELDLTNKVKWRQYPSLRPIINTRQRPPLNQRERHQPHRGHKFRNKHLNQRQRPGIQHRNKAMGNRARNRLRGPIP